VVRVVVEDQRPLTDPQQVATVRVGQVRVCQHVVRRPARHDAPGEEQEVVGLGGIAEIVGGHEDGAPGGPLGGDGIEDVLPGDEVEAGDRLVEQQHVGLLGEPLGDEGPLSLAAGQLVQRAPSEVRDGERVQGGIDGVAVAAAEATERAGGRVAAHRDGLPNGEREVLVHLRGLQDVRHPASARRRRDEQLARPRLEQAGHGVQQRGLPGAVRADERGDGARRHREGRRGEDRAVAVGELDLGGGDGIDLRMITIFSTFTAMRTVLVRTMAVVGTLAVAVAGCATEDGGSAEPRVVVTTNILGDVVEQLVGDLVEVEVIMPPNADPHDLAPSPQQAEAMRTADLLVVNGEGFEAGLDDTIEAAEADGATVIRATDAVPLRTFAEDGEDVVDPHVFTSPANMVLIARAIADRLAEEVPDLDTPAYRAQVDGYLEDLRALDAETEAVLAAVPAGRRLLVTNHDVFGYFADRYDFEVLGAVIPSGSTLAEPSSRELSELADQIEAAGVPAIFADTSSPTRLADALAGEGAAVEVVELYSESLGPSGSPGDTYLGMVRANAEQIAAALG
jgi:zinc/manganese transport system substrate-binding protein